MCQFVRRHALEGTVKGKLNTVFAVVTAQYAGQFLLDILRTLAHENLF